MNITGQLRIGDTTNRGQLVGVDGAFTVGVSGSYNSIEESPSVHSSRAYDFTASKTWTGETGNMVDI